MKTIKFKSDTDNEVCFIPESTREIKRAFIAFGINAWLVKFGGKYDIMYLGDKENKLVSTNCKTVTGMSLKGWIEFARKNNPFNFGEMAILWPEYIQKVEISTI